MGSGFHKAYSMETAVTAFNKEADERGTPYVEIDPIVVDYVREHGDWRVKEMFGRFIANDGGVSAIFPFKRLVHSYFIGGVGVSKLDPEKEKRNNDQLRRGIRHCLIEYASTLRLAMQPRRKRRVTTLARWRSSFDNATRRTSVLICGRRRRGADDGRKSLR